METLFVAVFLLCGYPPSMVGTIDGCQYQASRDTFSTEQECVSWLAVRASPRNAETLHQKLCIPLRGTQYEKAKPPCCALFLYSIGMSLSRITIQITLLPWLEGSVISIEWRLRSPFGAIPASETKSMPSLSAVNLRIVRSRSYPSSVQCSMFNVQCSM